MMVYGYQEVLRDRSNQVMTVVPVGKDVPLWKVITNGIGSLALWDESYVEKYFCDKTQHDDDDLDYDEKNDFPDHQELLETTIEVNGEWRTFRNMMIVYKNTASLYHFLKRSWKPSEDSFQRELSELIEKADPTATVLDMLELSFERKWSDVAKMVKKVRGGIIEYDSFMSELKGLRVDGNRFYFNDSPDSKQLVLLQMEQ